MTDATAQVVPIDLVVAARHLATARRMLRDAEVDSLSPEGRFTLLYDAARNAIVAALRIDGVRVTSGARAHLVTLAEAKRILGVTHATTLQRLNSARITRHAIEYENREVSTAEATALIQPVNEIIRVVAEILAQTST